MNALTHPRIESLKKKAGEGGKLNHPVGEGYLQINLLDENIVLWQETFEKNDYRHNILLACDKNSGDLSTAKLTWVVGSAIRGTTVKNAGEVEKLLTQMGIVNDLAQAAIEHCPGLGEDLIWAFYLERHGWLTATPVARTEGKLSNKVSERNSPKERKPRIKQ